MSEAAVSYVNPAEVLGITELMSDDCAMPRILLIIFTNSALVT